MEGALPAGAHSTALGVRIALGAAALLAFWLLFLTPSRQQAVRPDTARAPAAAPATGEEPRAPAPPGAAAPLPGSPPAAPLAGAVSPETWNLAQLGGWVETCRSAARAAGTSGGGGEAARDASAIVLRYLGGRLQAILHDALDHALPPGPAGRPFEPLRRAAEEVRSIDRLPLEDADLERFLEGLERLARGEEPPAGGAAAESGAAARGIVADLKALVELERIVASLRDVAAGSRAVYWSRQEADAFVDRLHDSLRKVIALRERLAASPEGRAVLERLRAIRPPGAAADASADPGDRLAALVPAIIRGEPAAAPANAGKGPAERAPGGR